jgi:hypothetical protein
VRERGKRIHSIHLILCYQITQFRGESNSSPFTVAIRHISVLLWYICTYKCKMAICFPAFDYDHHHYHYFPKCQQENLSTYKFMV